MGAMFAGGHNCKGEWGTANDHLTDLPDWKYPLLIPFPPPSCSFYNQIVDKIGQSLPNPPPSNQGLTTTKAEHHPCPVSVHSQLSEVCKERTKATPGPSLGNNQAMARAGRLQPFLSIHSVNIYFYTHWQWLISIQKV